MWLVTPRIKRILGGFHHRVARRISVKIPWKRIEGTWKYPPLGDTMRELVLEEIGTNISRWHKTVAQYVSNFPILDIFLCTERRLG